MTENKDKLWGGRFTQQTDRVVEQFTSSVAFDKRLYRHDIAGSIAHARMLHKVGVLTQAEFDAITEGLQQIHSRIESGSFDWATELEDVHMNIEQRLTDLIGEAGKKLHTGRSRNDQVATDLRLYAREATDGIIHELHAFQSTLLDLADAEAGTVLPGYTHLQIAQPITYGHHLMAWFEMLDRDRQRFIGSRMRVNQSPLGAAALAGTNFPIDREMTASELGFDGVMSNSIDAVSDRDFAMEIAANAAIAMVHLSRIGEELVIWNSAAYRFIVINDSYATGSSIMPQKKNPDIAELVRGKSARTAGNLQALLMLMKAQPLAYNRDNQEDKEALFDSLDTVSASIKIMHDMIRNISPDRERMRLAATEGFATATDLADYLVVRGVSFRDAHEVVGRIVRLCLENNCSLEELSLADLQRYHPSIDKDVHDILTPESSVRMKNHVGGTAPEQVLAAVHDGRRRLAET
ncbi:MAG: argininosuccinate lyase [Acidiferrobacterales bacterium]|nr:argininosuccinate lyase [Acidiferrobacterales bacterium]